MGGNISRFGDLKSGEPVSQIRIASGELSASVLTIGAVLQELRLEGFDKSLVLGLETLDHYLDYSPHFGAVAGRVANRLSFGRFAIDDTPYDVDPNIDGVHSLHGGAAGFGVTNWSIADVASDFVTLELNSPDGDMGFPGNLNAVCSYRIMHDAVLRIELTATTDAPTPCNLAPHSYFNLEGEGNILMHELKIAASQITEISEQLIPTGKLLPVEDTVFDFQDLRVVSKGLADGSMRYDHNYCLSEGPFPLRNVALLKAPGSGIWMSLSTTEPGLQLYDGAKIDVPVRGIDGRRFGANAGLCLETQHWPDAPNQPEFPDIILRPGMIYRHITEYAFKRHRN